MQMARRRDHQISAYVRFINHFETLFCNHAGMTKEPKRPDHEDDPAHWKRVIDEHQQERNALRAFISKRKEVFSFKERMKFDFEHAEFLYRAGILSSRFGAKVSSEVYNPAAAGVLKQANHQLREKLIALHPELRDLVPQSGKGDQSRDR